jgi:hypothetical protein
LEAIGKQGPNCGTDSRQEFLCGVQDIEINSADGKVPEEFVGNIVSDAMWMWLRK